MELLCIGNALVDIFAHSEEGLDLQFDLKDGQQHISMDRMRDILSVLPDFTVCSGGGAANVAKIASQLGIKAGFTGALGVMPGLGKELSGFSKSESDRFGQLFEEELDRAGVKSILIKKSSPTGICLMLKLPDGRIKIAAAPSAALELSAEDLKESLVEDMIRSSQLVVLDGFMLGRVSLVRHVLALADRHGCAVAIDLSSAGLAYERALDIVTYARAYPLIIFMNEDEAYAFYRAICKNDYKGDNSKNNKAGFNQILAPGLINLFKDFTANDIFPVLVVKLGIRGAVVFAGGNIFREETIPVIPLETTGAGDTFCAAFLSAFIRDKSFSECASLGNRAAREVLGVYGSQADIKALKQLEKFFK